MVFLAGNLWDNGIQFLISDLIMEKLQNQMVTYKINHHDGKIYKLDSADGKITEDEAGFQRMFVHGFSITKLFYL
jgi:hypothetical protein